MTAARQRRVLQKSAIDDYWHYHNVGNLGLTVTNIWRDRGGI